MPSSTPTRTRKASRSATSNSTLYPSLTTSSTASGTTPSDRRDAGRRWICKAYFVPSPNQIHGADCGDMCGEDGSNKRSHLRQHDVGTPAAVQSGAVDRCTVRLHDGDRDERLCGQQD